MKKQIDFLDEVPGKVQFSQIKPKNSPFNSGFIQYVLLILIITIPVAIVFGLLRAIIEDLIYSKFRPKEDAIVIDNAYSLKIIDQQQNNEFVSVKFNQITSVYSKTRSMMQFDLFPGRLTFSTMTYGTLFIVTKKHKYKIMNVKAVEVLVVLLNILIEDSERVKSLLLFNNYSIQKLHDVFESISTIFDAQQKTIIKLKLTEILTSEKPK